MSEYQEVFGGPAEGRGGFTQRLGRADPVTAEASENVAGSTEYKPYGFLPAGFGECCDVRRWIDGTALAEGIEFQYRFLMQLGYVGEEQITLFLPDCMVVIDGRRLRELRKRLARRQATFIQQYSPLVWPVPPGDEPLIASVTLVRPHAEPHGRNG